MQQAQRHRARNCKAASWGVHSDHRMLMLTLNVAPMKALKPQQAVTRDLLLKPKLRTSCCDAVKAIVGRKLKANKEHTQVEVLEAALIKAANSNLKEPVRHRPSWHAAAADRLDPLVAVRNRVIRAKDAPAIKVARRALKKAVTAAKDGCVRATVEHLNTGKDCDGQHLNPRLASAFLN